MRRLLVVGLVLALPATAAAAVPPGAAAPAPPTPAAAPAQVLVVGDSVLLGAREQILDALAATNVTVHAAESRPALAALPELTGSTADVVVVSLGHNDGPVGWSDKIDRIMGTLADAGAVVWLTQQEFRADRAEMNAALGEARARWPTLEVLDWNALVTATPNANWADGLHLRPEGAAAMAGAISIMVVLALAPSPIELAGIGARWSRVGLAAVHELVPDAIRSGPAGA